MKKLQKQYKHLAWRIKKLDELVRTGKCISVARVAKELEVAPRTIQRDLDFMRDHLESPLTYDSQLKKWIYTQPAYSVPDIYMTKSEYTAMLLAKKLVQQYTAVPIQEDVCSALNKLIEHLSEKETSQLLSFNNIEPISFSVRTANNVDKKIYQQILSAIEQKQTLKINYFTQSRGEETVREVDPYIIHNWYLVGFDHNRNKVLDFHIGRIRTIRETSNKFQIKSSFDKETYLAQGFNMFKGQGDKYLVEIEFSQHIARWIKEQKPLHISQVIQEIDNGKLILKLELNELQAVKRFVLQFGSQARVLQPLELKEMIKDELIKLANFYPMK